MKTTIFDYLTMPAFQEHTAMYMGKRNLETLNTWMHGYARACMDAGESDRLRTRGGMPFALLRDYIAMKEDIVSTAGIPGILREAVRGGDDSPAVDRFFSHVNAYLRLSILSVRRAEATPDTESLTLSSPEHTPFAFRKVSLTEGLCWIVAETPAGEEYWDCIGGTGEWAGWPPLWKIGPEADAERYMQRILGRSILWEATERSCYPHTPE